MLIGERFSEARAWLSAHLLRARAACVESFALTFSIPNYPFAREDLAVGSGLLLYNAATALCIAQTRGDLRSIFATVAFVLLACEVVFAIVYIRIRARRELMSSYLTLNL